MTDEELKIVFQNMWSLWTSTSPRVTDEIRLEMGGVVVRLVRATNRYEVLDSNGNLVSEGELPEEL